MAAKPVSMDGQSRGDRARAVEEGASAVSTGRRARLKQRTVHRWERVKRKILAHEDEEGLKQEHDSNEKGPEDSSLLRMTRSKSFSGVIEEESAAHTHRHRVAKRIEHGGVELMFQQQADDARDSDAFVVPLSYSSRLQVSNRTDSLRQRDLRYMHRSCCMSESELTRLVDKANEDAVDIERHIFSSTLNLFTCVPGVEAKVD